MLDIVRMSTNHDATKTAKARLEIFLVVFGVKFQCIILKKTVTGHFVQKKIGLKLKLTHSEPGFKSFKANHKAEAAKSDGRKWAIGYWTSANSKKYLDNVCKVVSAWKETVYEKGYEMEDKIQLTLAALLYRRKKWIGNGRPNLNFKVRNKTHSITRMSCFETEVSVM